jgi:hypothetical protein
MTAAKIKRRSGLPPRDWRSIWLIDDGLDDEAEVRTGL